jgi:hypothetical protein
MTDLPPLFGPKGAFCPLDDAQLASLNQMRAVAYEGVASAARELEAADAAVKAAQERVTSCVRDRDAAEQYITDNYQKLTFHDLWRQTVKGR